jgi:apolipoprotein N-acyltransferase
MMPASADIPTREAAAVARRLRTDQPWLWLIAAALLLLVADGRNTVAAAAWLAPLCLLRFLRLRPDWVGFAVAYAVRLITLPVAERGMIPVPGLFYYIFVVAVSGIALLPYFADRAIAPRLKPMPATLVFPAAMVTVQFLLGFGMHGSWGSLANTQSGDLALLQLLAVTGLAGVTFLIAWLAPVANLVLERGLDCRASRIASISFVSICLTVVLGGELRLAFFPPASRTLRVASFSPANGGAPIASQLRDHVIRGTATVQEMKTFDTAARSGQDYLLQRSAIEARAGAKIIFWSEGAATVLQPDELEFLRRGQSLAVQYRVYLGMTLSSWTPGQARPLQNKLVLIDPFGTIVWQYLKARPTPGPEAALSVKNDGQLRFLDSSYGRISAAICYDMDFPRLIAQAGRHRTGILLSPASDWRGIDPRHTQMASFRAIEQGFNLVREANAGFSAAYDYQGHRLAAVDAYTSPDAALVTEVPTQGTLTLYSILGDWFAYLCVATLLALAILAWRRPAVDQR